MNFQQIVQLVKESLFCYMCGQIFEDDNIHLAGAVGNMLLFHAFCDRGHQPSDAIIRAVAPQLVPLDGVFEKLPGEPLNTDDVLDLSNALVDFQGDFVTVFSKN